jgi:hypothetical protein
MKYNLLAYTHNAILSIGCLIDIIVDMLLEAIESQMQ